MDRAAAAAWLAAPVTLVMRLLRTPFDLVTHQSGLRRTGGDDSLGRMRPVAFIVRTSGESRSA